MKKLILPILATGLIVFAVSCKKDGSSGNLTIKMTDGPGDYQEVNVEIVSVDVHLEPDDKDAEKGWKTLTSNSGIYDLLELQNGADTVIADDSELPAGKITQMRLILGTNNTVMVDSIVHDMTVPSGSNTGIKLVGGIELEKDKDVSILIDFDAASSVVENGTGAYQLKPVIKVVK